MKHVLEGMASLIEPKPGYRLLTREPLVTDERFFAQMRLRRALDA